MNYRTVHIVLFSPTGTTRAVLDAIAKGTGGAMGKILDLTTSALQETPCFSETDLVLVGMPVYGGRLPALAVERFESIRGSQASVVPVVVYGNRHYDDALVELYALCKKQGFRPVAAGAFIGEHSFSTPELPLSPGRPDAADIEKATQFGRMIGDVDLDGDSIPGNFPYKAVATPNGSATRVDAGACTKCGSCIEVCPTQGMKMTQDGAESDPDNCIWCMACARACPADARTIAHEKIKASAQKLNDLFSERRESEFFLS